MTSSECPWCSPVMSGRTDRRGGEDRSWFGRPQAIKKAAGSAARNKGTNASKTCWRYSAAPPSSRQSVVSWVPFTNCQKKGAVPTRLPSSTHHPLAKGSRARRMTEEIPTSRRRYDQTTTGGQQTQEKAEVPPSALFDAFISYGSMLFYVRPVTNTSTIGRTAH